MTAPASAALPASDIACVIPCYNAGARVRPVVEAALRQTPHVWVVDDGCTDACIASLEALPARILRHARNRGKGHAILTGLRAALEAPHIVAVALLDADGQHDPAVLPRFRQTFFECRAGMVIGERVFDGRHVPLRSRFGNAVTAKVTRMLLRAKLPDTQCGYRLLSREFAGEVLEKVAGGRYETEMEMVVLAIRHGRGIASVPISTVYEPGNASSHFHKVGDSIRIYRRLISSALLSSSNRG
jgi:glycosyltransferase involved in cell wall biosynthesis